MDSFQEDVTQHLNPWSRILDEAQEMPWSTSTKGTEIREMWLTLKGRMLSFLSTERTDKSTVRVSAVEASDEERLHFPKGDGNPKRAQRHRWT